MNLKRNTAMFIFPWLFCGVLVWGQRAYNDYLQLLQSFMTVVVIILIDH